MGKIGIKKSKRRICFVITSPIHYSRNILILEELRKRRDVELSIVIGGAALISKYVSKFGDIGSLLRGDGFENIHEAYFHLEGDKPISKVKTTGLGIIEFSSIFNEIKPDIVVVRGDRFEVLAAAISATYLNISIAHIEGGDLSGTIDESVRHSITKISHLHFVTNLPAKERLIKMGENPEYVFHYGSPDIEVVKRLASLKMSGKVEPSTSGSGYPINYRKPYLMVMFHPVTTELHRTKKDTLTLLRAINQLGIQTVWFWPNADTGAEDISHELRKFKEENPKAKIRYMRYLPPKIFLPLLGGAKCLVGNSSAGIKETSYLGVPVVNVGTRQNSRLRAENVTDVESDQAKIVEAVKKQIKKGKYEVSDMYHQDDTCARIAETLAKARLYVQKKFHE